MSLLIKLFCEIVSDAENVFVLPSSSKHWAEKVSVNPDVGLVQSWQQLQ